MQSLCFQSVAALPTKSKRTRSALCHLRAIVDNSSPSPALPPSPRNGSARLEIQAERDFLFDGLFSPVDVLEWCPCADTRKADTIDAAFDGESSGEPSDVLPGARVDSAFVNTFRMSSPYIHAYHGLTFVIHVPGALVSEELFSSVMMDVALMRAIGIKPVLVLGPKAQIESRLEATGIPSKFVHGVRVTDARTLDAVKEAAGSMRFEVECVLARGVINMPSSSRVSVVSGSFYSAQPVGIIDGQDFGFTGRVRRIDVEGIHRRLDSGDILVIPNVGFSPSGQLFNCQSEMVASACAAQLNAEKLIFLSGEDVIRDKRTNRVIPNMTFDSAKRFLAMHGEQMPPQFRTAIEESVTALRAGVRRAHLLNRFINGVLLMEVFHRDGVGLMISRDVYEGIRPAKLRDVMGMLEIIQPLMKRGILKARDQSSIEHEIDNYVVIERDGMIIACLSLCVMREDPAWAELGCFAVHDQYRKLGKGDAMMSFVELMANKKGVRNLIILSTQSFHFFMDKGFTELSMEELPQCRRATYDFERRPKIFRKILNHGEPVRARALCGRPASVVY